jgi:hypothetical protein
MYGLNKYFATYMNKLYIAIIGIYDENTTEQIVLKETGVNAINVYEAHKQAFWKCNVKENQTVLRILEADTRKLQFDFQKGFTP